MGINRLIISDAGKKKYLTKLYGKMIKILHLIEEEKTTQYSPRSFIYGQLLELNSANQLFDNELTEIIVKLNIVYHDYAKVSFKDIKKIIFGINNQIIYIRDHLIN